MIIIKVEKTSKKLSLKEYMEEVQGYSGRQIKKLFKEKKIKLNGKTGYWDNPVEKGDSISIDLAESIKSDIMPQNIPIDILYEDEYLLAVNKPAHMLVHPTENHVQDTLANGLRYYFDDSGLQVPIRFLNRIDMDTSGIVVIPKSSRCHSALMQLMEKNEITKTYEAVSEGVLRLTEGTIDLPIGKDAAGGIKRVVTEKGQAALTQYSTIKILNQASWLTLKLITGRTHQIRVHLSHLGNPIIGDTLYGRASHLIDRQALHACKMEFVHPFTNESLSISAPLPEDMRNLIEALSGLTVERK